MIAVRLGRLVMVMTLISYKKTMVSYFFESKVLTSGSNFIIFAARLNFGTAFAIFIMPNIDAKQ